MKTLFAIILLVFGLRLTAQDSPTPLREVKEGVYLRNLSGFVTVFELKDGQVRFWTGMSNRTEGLVTRLLTGTYGIEGGTLSFTVRKETLKQTFELMSAEHQGRVILWTAAAKKNWESAQSTRRLSLTAASVATGVFYLTNGAPENLLEEQIALAGRPAIPPARIPETATPLGYVPEGIFFNDFIANNQRAGTRTLVYANVLELKDGQFRFWQSRGSNKTQEAWSSLESGKYATNGGTVIFEIASRTPNAPAEWTFMHFRGQTSVWINSVLDEWKKTGNLNLAGVHFLTDRKPENIIEGK